MMIQQHKCPFRKQNPFILQVNNMDCNIDEFNSREPILTENLFKINIKLKSD